MMLVPLPAFKSQNENAAAHAPFADHRHPDPYNPEWQQNSQNITQHHPEQPHGKHGNNRSIFGIPRCPERGGREKADGPEGNLGEAGYPYYLENRRHNGRRRMKKGYKRAKQRHDNQKHQDKRQGRQAEKRLYKFACILYIPSSHALADHGNGGKQQ